MDILQDLNGPQRDAVTSGDQPVIIIAGPGTGKTKTLTARIVHLLEQGAEPHSILALTFTNKAAREMESRVRALVGASAKPIIATFHALCLSIVQDSQPDRPITFATDADRTAAIKKILSKTKQKDITARELGLRISRYKGQVVPLELAMAETVRVYDELLASQELIDFDDVLLKAYALLRDDKALRTRLNRQYQHILIDEFQDTSQLQWEIVQLLRGSDSVFVIGDPKQSIYGFRGISGDMFEAFRTEFPNHRCIVLHTNYRSRAAIVNLTNAIFADDTALTPHQTKPGRVQVLQTFNEYSEADLVLHIIEQGIGGSDFLKVTTDTAERGFRDFAVLYRTHHAARAVQQRLHDSGIPYQVVGEGSPYERPEVQAIIEAFRWVQDSGHTMRVTGYTPVQAKALLESIDASLPLSQLAEHIAVTLALHAGDARKKLDIQQFVGSLVRFDAHRDSVAAYLEYFDTIAQHEFYDSRADAVTLLTIHAVKGLEFTHVILIGAEEGTLPHIRKTELPNIAEEQRLFYVAVSRAKKQLDIIYAKKRGNEPAIISQFVKALSVDVLPRDTDPALPALEKRLVRRQQKARQASLF